MGALLSIPLLGTVGGLVSTLGYVLQADLRYPAATDSLFNFLLQT